MLKMTYHCDKCQEEMPKPAMDNEFVAQGVLFGVTMTPFPVDDKAKFNDINQFGNLHICKYCIIDLIIRELDDRPKAL